MRTILSLSFLLFVCVSCNKALFKPKWTTEQAPESFVTRFETSKGNFDVQVTREWSPKAADRFYQLVKHGFYNNALFYRVVPNFVAQFGNTDTTTFNKWMQYKLPDEPVVHSNKKGAISFARSGKETRGRELFINLNDNTRLDTVVANGVKGYPPFGDVISGMDVVLSLNSSHGNNTLSHVNEMYKSRFEFLKTFPGLDSVKKAYVVKSGR
jgi:cyclophilin family peptidyl-prolyl cis-trans isomerase